MKKILIINWRDINNPEAGGAEIYFHEIFRRLVSRGYKCTVLAHQFKGGEKETVIDGLRVIRISNKFTFNFSVIPYLLKHQNEYDLIIEDLNKLPFFTPIFVRRKRMHMVMHLFGRSIFSEAPFPLALYVFLMEKLIPFIYRKEEFVAISESTKSEVNHFGIPKEKIKVVEPGIDTSFFTSDAPKSHTPLLVYIGRLMRYKNVQFVIRAIRRLKKDLPDIQFEVAGSGDYTDKLKDLVKQLGVEQQVRFAGRIDENQKRTLLSRATLFVNPSSKEGWGINNIEANLCGTISLSSNVPGLRDSVCDGVTGMLYTPENMDDFCQKVLLLHKDVRLRETMEQAAIKRGKTFEWPSIAERMEECVK